MAVVEGITEPAEAVRRARIVPGQPVEPPAELAELATKADAVRLALRECADDSPRSIAAWLGARGVEVGPTYVADVIRRDAEKNAKQISNNVPVPSLAELSKADAVRAALAAVDDQTPRVVAAWLAARGIEVATTYVTDVQRRDASKTGAKQLGAGEPDPDDSGPLRLAG